MAVTPRTLRLTVGPQAVALVLVAIFAGILAFGISTAASRTIGWAVACAVVASLIEPLVAALDRWMPRALAIAVVLVGVGLSAAAVAGGILVDLDQQFDRLVDVAPQAADQVERSDQFGDLARDFRLEQRVTELVDRLQEPTSGLAAEAPTTTSTYLVCAVLIAFFLSWGPNLARSALEQLPDHRRRDLRVVGGTGFARARRYALAALARALLAGSVAYGLCHWSDVPLPVVLSVAVGAMSIVPGFGIMVGALPALLLKTGFDPGPGAVWLLVAFAVLQFVDEVVLRKVVAPRSLTVGPAAIVIALVVGFEIYGVGGAFYGAALATLGVGLLDAAARQAGIPAD